MAIRVIAFCDAGVPVSKREQLPGLLTEALKARPYELEALDFNPAALDQSRWIWDWNPDLDGDFRDWLSKDVVGLSWPNDSGIAVHCGNYMTLVYTGVRWDIFNQDGRIRDVVIRVVCAIGRTLGAKEAWLIPDAGDATAAKALDMFFEGSSSVDLATMVKRSPSVRVIEC